MAFYDSDGVEVTGYTQEQIDAYTQEKQAELQAVQAELDKLKEKDLNFSNLRSQKDEAEKKVDALKVEIDEKIAGVKKEVFEGVLKDHYSQTLSGLAGDDQELLKKIEYHYARLNDPATSNTEIDKKLRDAWSLATAVEGGILNSAAISSGGTGIYRPAASHKAFTEQEKAFARQMAAAGGMILEDKDF